MKRRIGSKRSRSKPAAWPAAIVLALSLHLLFGCALTGTSPHAGQYPVRSVWLVAPGWHAGLAVRRADIPEGLLPESADFPGARYLEVGWGERDYYQARESSVWLALKAALIPSPSVLHVAGLDKPPAAYFGSDSVLRIDLPDAEFRNLVAYLHESFNRRGAPRIMPLGPGLYGDSRFYEAQGRFHLFNNCSTWAAGALEAAGLPASPFRIVTASSLRCQARHWGATESRRPEALESRSAFR